MPGSGRPAIGIRNQSSRRGSQRPAYFVYHSGQCTRSVCATREAKDTNLIASFVCIALSVNTFLGCCANNTYNSASGTRSRLQNIVSLVSEPYGCNYRPITCAFKFQAIISSRVFSTFAIIGVATCGMVYVPMPACKQICFSMMSIEGEGSLDLVIDHLLRTIALLQECKVFDDV